MNKNNKIDAYKISKSNIKSNIKSNKNRVCPFQEKIILSSFSLWLLLLIRAYWRRFPDPIRDISLILIREVIEFNLLFELICVFNLTDNFHFELYLSHIESLLIKILWWPTKLINYSDILFTVNIHPRSSVKTFHYILQIVHLSSEFGYRVFSFVVESEVVFDVWVRSSRDDDSVAFEED